MGNCEVILSYEFPISRSTNCLQIRQNHYDVLEVKQNCTSKDIREAFIRLSKKHHPDSSGKTLDSAKFRDIIDAYKTLGKEDSRIAYDHSLQFDYPYERVNSVEYDGQ